MEFRKMVMITLYAKQKKRYRCTEAEQVKNKINAMHDPRLGLGLKQTV